jgi:cilia- and flagella-associated protein 57
MQNSSFQNEWLLFQEEYGIDANAKPPLYFLDNEKFIHIVGCNLSIFSLKTHKRKLNHLNFKESVELVVLSLNKKNVLIVDYELKNSNIYLYDISEVNESKIFKRSKSLENEIITDICISSNTELIAYHAINGTDRNLKILSFGKLKLLAKTKILSMNSDNENKVKKIDFFPNDNKRILLLGHKIIKIYLYASNSVKSILNFDCHIYLEFFSWLGKNEIISFDKYGHLYLIEPKQNTIRTLNLNQKDNESNAILVETRSLVSYACLSHKESSLLNKYLSPVKRIICVLKGFFMLHLNDDLVKYYKIEETEMFTYNLVFLIRLSKGKSLKYDKNFREIILDICINEAHTNLIALTNCKKIYYYDLKDFFKKRHIDGQSGEFEMIIDNYHYDNVTGLDFSISKPIIITCSLDRALTIYNYDTNSIELRQYFEDDLFGVTVHPSGLYLILSTAKCLKYMCIYLDSLKVMHVINVRSCTTCIYSNNGNLFAFVHGTVIQIYSSLKFSEIGSIKGHDMGKIKQLSFSRDDHYLLCCSMAGIIRVWNSNTLTLICEITTKGKEI